MKKFASAHKHHLGVLLILIIIAVISGFFAFQQKVSTPPTVSTTQASTSTTDLISISQDESEEVDQENNENVYTNVDIFNSEATPLSQNNENINEKNPLNKQNIIKENVKTLESTLFVQDSVYKIDLFENANVYDLMLALQNRGDIEFKARDFGGDLGYFVEEINGLKQSQVKRKYWVYYINGKKAKIGISNYILQPNDIISWQYEDDETL